MLYGAAATGARAMTTSSSPGIALMQEGMSMLSAAELPCVIVNVQRGGPGIGSIQPSQADYYQMTRGGGNGDYRIISLAPSIVQEGAEMLEAFDLADYYRTPVFIVSDGMLGQMKHVTWLPSYGPEMRGGTAYCNVVVSDTPVGSPLVTGNADCAILMNLPSLLKFEESVREDEVILVNSSLTDKKVSRDDVRAYYIAAVLGTYLALSGVVQPASITKAFKKVFGDKSEKLLDLNIAALRKGNDAVLNRQDVLLAS